MYQIFITPSRLLSVLSELHQGSWFRIIAQRFEQDGGLLGFEEVVNVEGEFFYPSDAPPSRLYLSGAGVPKHAQDWAFLDRKESQLIEIAGGRAVAEALEVATLRKFAKRSEMDALYRKLTKALSALSKPGVQLNGHPYPKIRVESGLKGYRLFMDLESKSIEASKT